jgi:hypothetical protein
MKHLRREMDRPQRQHKDYRLLLDILLLSALILTSADCPLPSASKFQPRHGNPRLMLSTKTWGKRDKTISRGQCTAATIPARLKLKLVASATRHWSFKLYQIIDNDTCIQPMELKVSTKLWILPRISRDQKKFKSEEITDESQD